MDHFTAPDVPGFLVGRMLGRGGSSTVWLVTEERTGREFALKCLGGEAGTAGGGGDVAPAAEAPGEEGVRREIRILSVLDHQHLIKAHDALRFARQPRPAGAAETDGTGIGLLLDYAPGGSLAELVGSRRKLPVGETVTVLTPIAQVLGYLHAKGFTHGDVSPGNVLFTGHGKPMLSDVGIARMVGDASAVADHGTAGFMDPAPVDAVRAGLQPERDVFSVAALGWYCLTGEAPRRSADRPPLSLLLPEVPPELAAALEGGLNEDRRLRPTAVELATAIYRSAPPLPIDLASSVHATVIPQLLTRRRIPERPDGAVRNGLRAWHRRLSTSRWSGLIGVRQALPFPAEEDASEPKPRTADADLPAGLSLDTGEHHTTPRGRHAVQPGADSPRPGAVSRAQGSRVPKAVHRRGTVLLAAGAAAVVAGVIWTAGAFGPGGPFTGLAGYGEPAGGSGSAQEARNGVELVPSGQAANGTDNRGIPVAVAAQLGSQDPAVAVHGLAAVRSLAFSSGRLELLDLVNAPGSAAAATDAGLKDELRGSGHILAGFTSTVSDVQVQPGASAGQAIVGVMSATSPYVEQDGSGAAVAAAAAGTKQALRLVLVTLEGQWRITDVLPGS
ncbi:serine/threonine protein kinase [Pseudarthrobacter sp. TAF60_1]|uniref:serine/threonine protein kinase n=1 Tax=Pseudarthrobacter sp. TAF60_1 TaxID=3233071 RepID=UPI003F99F806